MCPSDDNFLLNKLIQFKKVTEYLSTYLNLFILFSSIFPLPRNENLKADFEIAIEDKYLIT